MRKPTDWKVSAVFSIPEEEEVETHQESFQCQRKNSAQHNNGAETTKLIWNYYM